MIANDRWRPTASPRSRPIVNPRLRRRSRPRPPPNHRPLFPRTLLPPHQRPHQRTSTLLRTLLQISFHTSPPMSVADQDIRPVLGECMGVNQVPFMGRRTAPSRKLLFVMATLLSTDTVGRSNAVNAVWFYTDTETQARESRRCPLRLNCFTQLRFVYRNVLRS
jgi:hypothetical protein